MSVTAPAEADPEAADELATADPTELATAVATICKWSKLRVMVCAYVCVDVYEVACL